MAHLTDAFPDPGNVFYRSRMHTALKRNFQLMPGAEWLELLLRHIHRVPAIA